MKTEITFVEFAKKHRHGSGWDRRAFNTRSNHRAITDGYSMYLIDSTRKLAKVMTRDARDILPSSTDRIELMYPLGNCSRVTRFGNVNTSPDRHNRVTLTSVDGHSVDFDAAKILDAVKTFGKDAKFYLSDDPSACLRVSIDGHVACGWIMPLVGGAS